MKVDISQLGLEGVRWMLLFNPGLFQKVERAWDVTTPSAIFHPHVSNHLGIAAMEERRSSESSSCPSKHHEISAVQRCEQVGGDLACPPLSPCAGPWRSCSWNLSAHNQVPGYPFGCFFDGSRFGVEGCVPRADGSV